MSQIFDALQRSEAERNGKNSGSDSSAAELLQRAEVRTGGSHRPVDSAVWNSVITPEPVITIAEPEIKSSTGISAAVQVAAAVLPKEERIESPMQCETLTIAPPAEGHLVSLPEGGTPASEAFHLLGIRLRHLRRQRPLNKLLVTSTIPQEGKSMVAANLACTLALRTQQKVLLLEGDVRRPTQSRIFGVANRPGICNWLNGERSLISCMYRLEGPGIWILPAGGATGNSLELLQSGRMTPMMEQLTNWFDWVVIDSPPVLPLADTSVWTNIADGVLLVVRQGTTQKRQLERGLEAISSQKLIGALLNSAKSVAHSDYYYRPTSRLPNDDAEA